MEIENIVSFLTGFIPTLVSMEVAWRLAKRQSRKAPIATSYIDHGES